MPLALPQTCFCSLRFLGAGAVLSLILLTFLLFDRSNSGLDAGAGYILKTPSTGLATSTSAENCPDGISPVEVESQSQSGLEGPGKWEFDVLRDGDDHGLSEDQCLSAFPKLFGEVNRTARLRIENENFITFGEVDGLARGGGVDGNGNGLVRGMVLDGEVSFTPISFLWVKLIELTSPEAVCYRVQCPAVYVLSWQGNAALTEPCSRGIPWPEEPAQYRIRVHDRRL